MSTATQPQGSLAAAELFPIPVEPHRRRLESLDILRGLLMILMALDHTRDYFSNAPVNPVDPHTSWPALYITRWVTHLCAPGFVALAGASVYLQRKRGKTPTQLSRLLITRGLWLVFLEFTVISFAWSFGWAPFMQVIWAIGISMILLGVIMRFRPPTALIGTLGATIVLLHNLLDPLNRHPFGWLENGWEIINMPGFFMFHGQREIMMFYPVLPWFGIICVGYAFGPIAASAPARRQKIAVALAASFFTVFSLLRLFHGYGDPFPFEHLATPAQTAMSFMSVMKYPPSLHYALATFTVLLLLYAAFDFAATRDWLPRLRAVFETYGRVPFFYYVPHIFILHGLALLGVMAFHLNWHIMIGKALIWDDATPPNWGFGLPIVYAIWLSVVALLYLPCNWFAALKARRRDW